MYAYMALYYRIWLNLNKQSVNFYFGSERETIEVFLQSTYEVEMIDVQEPVEAEAGHDDSMGSSPQPSTSKGAI